MLNVHLKDEEMDAIFLFFDRDDYHLKLVLANF